MAMSGRRPLSEAERQASDWIVRMRGAPSSREREQFDSWLNADPANAKAYQALERTWEKIASNPSLKGRAGANHMTPSRPRWRTPALAIAASALLAIGALAWFTQQQPATITAEHLRTAPGELRTITLADGSSIELSGGSEASLQVTAGERRVDLNSGYALFDVAHDPERPFVVHTPRGDIRVLGTSFVIRVTDAQVRTTVLRGSVSGAAQRTGLLSALGPRESVTAGANQEIVLDDEGAEVAPIAAEIIPRRLAWQSGMLAFDGETLNEAIAEVSRQTGWRFELADPDLGQMRVGGYVAADAEAFIALVSSSLNLEARRQGERRVVFARRT
jgi:transmembrane sensor